jgi:hypothetical protein
MAVVTSRGLPNLLTLLQMDGKSCSEAHADVVELSRLNLKWERDFIYFASRVPIAGLTLE